MILYKKNTFYFWLGFVSWLLFSIYNYIFGTNALHSMAFRYHEFLADVLFVLFIFTNFLYLQKSIYKYEKLDINEHFLYVNVTGIIGLAFLLALQVIRLMFGNSLPFSIEYDQAKESFFWYFIVHFLGYAYFFFRRLSLYQRTKKRLDLWKGMEILLGACLVIAFENAGFMFEIYLKYILGISALLISVFISFSVDWIAYLNTKQKLNALISVTLFLLIGLAFLYISDLKIQWLKGKLLYDEILFSDYFFIGVIGNFVIIYGIISLLILVFNLPTSSLFEQRSDEIFSFQRINQTIRNTEDKQSALNALMDAALLSANTSFGWIENYSDKKEDRTSGLTIRNLKEEEAMNFTKDFNLSEMVLNENKFYQILDLKKDNSFKLIKTRFKSLLVVPIQTSGLKIGALFLLSEVSESFTDRTLLTLMALCEQTAVALENKLLLKESLDLERYKVQLTIAREIQDGLLPKIFPQSNAITFSAKALYAEEVGGDYFDIISLDKDSFRVCIGDVSGKGTQAAFIMAEMKGIFHALAKTEYALPEIMSRANEAVLDCLGKGTFVTFILIDILIKENKVSLCRAGHCPPFLYKSITNTVTPLIQKGIGLGIASKNDFEKNLTIESYPFEVGDQILLYTDGIVEARNHDNEEFGYEKLSDWFLKNQTLQGSTAEKLLSDILNWTQKQVPEDDFSVLSIKRTS